MLSNQKLVSVYSTMDKVKVLIAKSMLNDAGIAYTISGAVYELEGVGGLGMNFLRPDPVVFQVLESDARAARECLAPLINGPEPIEEETLAKLAAEAGFSEEQDDS